jgi:hypothetical protein
MNRKINVDYILFEEAGQHVAFAPQLELCFNASEKEEVIKVLKIASKMQLKHWKKKNLLRDKINVLGLGRISKEKRSYINKGINVPYDILRNKHSLGKIPLTIKM